MLGGSNERPMAQVVGPYPSGLEAPRSTPDAITSHTVSMGGSRDGTDSPPREANQSFSGQEPEYVKYEKVFLFVNPSSGGNAASEFTVAGLEQMHLSKPKPLQVYIFDITEGKSGEKTGFNVLRDEIEEMKSEAPPSSLRSNFIRILAAGGDGTVMWVADEVEKHRIDSRFVAIGVIPYGTGNDFAKALGWASTENVQPYNRGMTSFRSLMGEWMDAAVSSHDLWEVVVAVKDGGTFLRIDASTRQKTLYHQGTRRINFTMSNYFSIGVESRIGIGFDRHRTKNQFRNKLAYLTEGLKKSLFKRTPRVDFIVQDMIASDALDPTPHDVEESVERQRQRFFDLCDSVESRPQETVFTTVADSEAPKLRDCASLIALNIPSFASGNDIWANSVGNLAITVPRKKVIRRGEL
eukprot:GHVN01005856.1.p1 GENE.GHVN01005856.1~~GHVN01005856.1.p1  ORF type:complete len:409 (-),score=42.53 GHVN01005856.1:614-1840(-)